MAENDQSSWIFDENDPNGGEKVKKKLYESTTAKTDDLIERLSKDGTPDEVLQRLIDADLKDVGNMTDSYRESLQTVIGGILQNTSIIGKEFDDLRKFNATEQGLKDEATRVVKAANDELNEVKEWGDWRNLFFGWKDSTVKAKEAAIQEAIKTAQELDTKAAMLFDERLRKAEINEQLDQFRHMTTIALNNLNKVADGNVEQFDQIKVRHAKAMEIVQKASKQLEELLADYQKADTKLKEETAHLADFVNGTPDYAKQKNAIDLAQQEYDRIKGERDKMQAAYNSKEKFAAILQTNMTALKVSTNNLRALAIKLRSDNEEREYTYQNTIQLIKASNSQLTGSSINEVGDETDQKNLEVAVLVATASDKDALERLYQHPENMKRALKVMEAFAKVRDSNKEKALTYLEIIKNGYENADLGGNGAELAPATEPNKRITTEDLIFDKKS